MPDIFDKAIFDRTIFGSLIPPWLSGNIPNETAAAVLDFKNNRYAIDQSKSELTDTLTFSRSSVQTFEDSAGVIQTAAINDPAIDVRGLAIFQDSENLILGNSNIDTGFTALNVTKTLAQTAPDGSDDAVLLTATTENQAARIQRPNVAVTSGVKYTLSCFTKAGTANAALCSDRTADWVKFDLSGAGSVVEEKNWTGAVERLGNTDYYRISATFTAGISSADFLPAAYISNGGTVFNRPESDAGDSCTVWGLQLEEGNLTPYIATGGLSTETRAFPNADIEATEFADLFVNGEFSIVYDFTVNSIKDTSQLLWQMDASDGRVFLELGASGNISFGVQSDGATNFIGLGAIEAGKDYRLIVGAEDGDIVAQLSNGGIEYRTYNLPTLTDWDFAKTNFKPDVYTGYLAWYTSRLPNGTLAAAADFVLEGDSYASNANGIGLKASLIADDKNIWTTAIGGSTLEACVARLEAMQPKAKVIFCDGSVNSHGTVAQDIAKYQRAYDAARGNIVFVSPVLYSGLAGTADGQFTLDLTAAMLLEGWKVVDGTAIARTLSGVTFTDAQDADDAGYADTAYDALFQADNVHPEQALADALTDAALTESSIPSNTVLPVISGTEEVGETLSVTNGSWNGFPTPTYAYQWERLGVNISGATSSTYTLVEADEGDTLTCVVTATNSEGSVGAESAATGVIAAGSTFAPTDISNLAVWYDASDESTITETSGSVSQWDDKSGNDYHAEQATGADQPTTGTRTVNGLNVIDFDGSTNGFRIEGGIPDATFNGNNTAFVLYQTDTTGADQIPLSGMSGGSFRFGVRHFGGSLQLRNQNVVSYSRTADANPHITGGVRDGTTQTVFYDGNTSSDTNAANPNVNNGFQVGYTSESGGKHLNGTISEIVLYDKALTTTELNQVGNYLADKWGITWTDIT